MSHRFTSNRICHWFDNIIPTSVNLISFQYNFWLLQVRCKVQWAFKGGRDYIPCLRGLVWASASWMGMWRVRTGRLREGAGGSRREREGAAGTDTKVWAVSTRFNKRLSVGIGNKPKLPCMLCWAVPRGSGYSNCTFPLFCRIRIGLDRDPHS